MYASVLDALKNHEQQHAEKLACRYHDSSPGTLSSLNFGDLSHMVRRVAASLSRRARPGERIALLLPNSVEYIVSLLGAQAAGLIPVPLMAPPSNQSNLQAQRLAAILDDCRPGHSIIAGDAVDATDSPSRDQRLRFDALLDDGLLGWRDVQINDTAFLQYTSGSTSAPKGVVVRHTNLVANSLHISQGVGTRQETIVGSWLPLFHDMGLMGKVIHPLLLGASAHYLRPETFLRYPRKWLEMISKEGIHISAAPNFAYERCAAQIEDLEGLDLSTWSMALNGSEAVSAETLDRFAARFGAVGFRRESFQPVYGLAEATLLATSRVQGQPIRERVLSVEEVASGRGAGSSQTDASGWSKRCVSVGSAPGDARLVVWNPTQQRVCNEAEVGEILLAGPHCCTAYFGQPELSEATFAVRLPAATEAAYLRTGDLGMQVDGELYITGRVKELIIVRGRNVYPEDIETVAQDAVPELVRYGGAAFEVEHHGAQRLVLIQEIGPRVDEDIKESMRRAALAAVNSVLQIRLDAVVLVRRGTLPKTTSGKIARTKARDIFLAAGFGVNADEVLSAIQQGIATDVSGQDATAYPALDGSRVLMWILGWISTRVPVGSAVHADRTFVEHGLDSIDAVDLLAEFGKHFGVSVETGALWEFPTPRRLASHLSGEPASDTARGHQQPDASALHTNQRRNGEADALIDLLEEILEQREDA